MRLSRGVMDRSGRGFMDWCRAGFKHSEHAAGVFEGPPAFLGDGLGFLPLHPGHGDLKAELAKLLAEGVNRCDGAGVMAPGHPAPAAGVSSAWAVQAGAGGEEAVNGDSPSPVVSAGGAGNLPGLEPAA